LSVSSARFIGFGNLLIPVWGLLFILGHRSRVLVTLAIFFVALDIVFLIRGVMLMQRIYRDLSKRFETKVWFLDSPSLRDGRFESWCQRHGVEPNTGTPRERPRLE
jgi:hypothetical protein